MRRLLSKTRNILGFCLVLTLGSAAVSGCGGSNGGQDGFDVAFEMIAQGATEDLQTEFKILTNQAELEDVYGHFINNGTAPTIDFETKEVVYASMGRQITSGYQLNLLGISRVEIPNSEKRALEFGLLATLPADNCPQDSVITSPFVLAAYDRQARIDALAAIRAEATIDRECP